MSQEIVNQLLGSNGQQLKTNMMTYAEDSPDTADNSTDDQPSDDDTPTPPPKPEP